MKLSIVASLYCSAPYIQEFCARCGRAARELVGEDYEIVLVNDGSPDTSLEIAIHHANLDKHLKVIDLSRNFGHHRAMMAGLEHANGDRIFLLDADLEELPEWLPEFWTEMDKTRADVIYGVQSARKGNWFERISGATYYKIFAWLSDLSLQKNQVTARLMTQRFKNALLQFQERNIVFNCLVELAGYKQIPHYIVKGHTSPTTYTLQRKFSLVLNTLTSFSAKPLSILFYSGILIFFISILMACWFLIKNLVWGIAIEGWTSLMLSVWILGGFIISQIGLCSLYIAKIFIETKKRPPYIVRDIYTQNNSGGKLL